MGAFSILLVIGLLLAGCSSSARPAPQELMAPATGPEPQPLAPGAAMVGLKLSRVIVEMPKGAVLGEQKLGPLCSAPEPLKWNSDARVYAEGAYHDAFDATLNQYNFIAGKTVPGKTTLALFDAPAAATAGELLVGARITDIRQNDCMNHGIFALPVPGHKGSVRFSVHWEVYSPKEQKIVLALDNEGAASLDEFKTDGDTIYFARAFGAALKGLLRNEEFRRLVTARK